MLKTPSPDSHSKSNDVFSSVLLSDDIHSMHSMSQGVVGSSRKSQTKRFNIAPRANAISPAEDENIIDDIESDTFDSDDFDSFSDSFLDDDSDELEISAQEFNSKPLSWRVSYVVMRQFQESSNLLRVTTELDSSNIRNNNRNAINASRSNTFSSWRFDKDRDPHSVVAGQQPLDKITNHVDLATQSNFYDIDPAHKKRLARASFFKAGPDIKKLQLAHKRRCCIFMDRFVLTPDSSLRQFWDIMVLFLLLYTLIYLPIKVAFVNNNNNNSDNNNTSNKIQIDPLDITVDILFFWDIIMSFITAQKLPDGTLVKKFDEIAISYIKTWFILDVIATFPFYLIGSETLDRIAPIVRIPRLLKMLRLVRLVKLVRAYRLKKFFEKVEYSPKIHQGFIRIFKLLLLVVCFAHFSACLWFFIGDLSEESEGFSWISDIESVYGGVKDEPTTTQYIASLYFAISTLSTVGFGDITPQNGQEMAFAVVLMLIGATTFSYITATISSVMHDFDVKASLYRSKMANLVRFVKTTNLSKKLSNKLINDMSTLWRTEIRTNEDTSKLRDELPRLLLYEVSLEMHAHLINTSAFFRLFDNLAQMEFTKASRDSNIGAYSMTQGININKTPSPLKSTMGIPTSPHSAPIFGHFVSDFSFIGELVSEMRPETAFDGEFIANVAEPVNFWAIIKSGSVVGISAIDSTLELMLWSDGDSLGEVGIFLTQQWPWNMRCTEDTAYFTVSTSDFLAIIAHHRSVSRKLVKLAGQRIERIVKIKKKLRSMQETKLRRSFSRSSKQLIQDKAKLHYRLQNLMNDKKDEISRNNKEKSTSLATSGINSIKPLNGDDIGTDNEIVHKIRGVMRNDPLKGTAKGRWKMLRLYVHELSAFTRHKRDRFRINFQEVTQLAMQVKRFQDALDEIQRDMIIWKQGMTFKANRSNRNFLQPAVSLIHEE